MSMWVTMKPTSRTPSAAPAKLRRATDQTRSQPAKGMPIRRAAGITAAGRRSFVFSSSQVRNPVSIPRTRRLLESFRTCSPDAFGSPEEYGESHCANAQVMRVLSATLKLLEAPILKLCIFRHTPHTYHAGLVSVHMVYASK